MRAALVVLGDLGRSPRMLFHARALAEEGLDVDLVGASGTSLPAFIADAPRVHVHIVEHATGRDARRSSIFGTAMRGLRLLAALLRVLLWELPRPDLILVQNPPGVPTLAAAWLAARCRSARFAVDWHNMTSAMLALRFGARHSLVRVVASYEGLFGRSADVNLFVSSAMRDLLDARHSIRGTVFRDQPADIFDPMSGDMRQRVRAGLFERFAAPGPEPALLISPTSWTADERMDLLLDALDEYETVAARDDRTRSLPPVLMLITGSGPLKQAFEQRLSQMRLTRVAVRTAWFEAGEYPHALAAADLGLCCHDSASGVDLPMKIADMFGAGIPVCAFDYGPCLQELVHPGVDGVLFKTGHDCCAQLDALLRGYPASDTLARLKAGVIAGARPTWGDAWRRDARAALVGT